MPSADEKLIRELIQKCTTLQQKFSSAQVQTKLSQHQIQELNIQESSIKALISLSSTKLEVVLDGLVEQLTKASEDIVTFIFDIMERCMTKFTTQKEFRLNDAVSSKAINAVQGFLLKPLGKTPEDQASFTEACGKVFYKLSALSPDYLFNKLTSITINTINEKDTDESTNQYLMVEYLYFNSQRLSDLLNKIHQAVPAYTKKNNRQAILARVLRSAIWNWIDHNPEEFEAISKSGKELDGKPSELFEVLNNWVDKTEKFRSQIWPCQIALLLLCPDILLSIYNKNKSEKIANKEKLLDTLKKSLKAKGTADVVIVCYSDLCKAATCINKTEANPLRHMVPPIEVDLEERLFDLKSGDLDEKSMVDIIVNSYRLSPGKVKATIFPKCLNAESPSPIKMALVKALLRIAREGKRRPWDPTIADSYSSVYELIRRLFKDCLKSAMKHRELLKDVKSKGKELDKLEPDINILKQLLLLFSTDPGLPLFASGTFEKDVETVRSLTIGICDCIGHFAVPDLVNIATNCIVKLHLPSNIPLWTTEKNVTDSFWDTSSHLIISLSNILIENKELKPPQIMKVLNTLEVILQNRNQFLRNYKLGEINNNSMEIRITSYSKLETALLINLCGDIDICGKSSACFGLICDEIQITGEEVRNVFVLNYQVYSKIRSAGVGSAGRVAQQLAIRKLLRRLNRTTEGNFVAWQEVYDRWNQFYNPLVLSYIEETNTDTSQTKKKMVIPQFLEDKSQVEIQQEWHNITGFLVSLCGVCVNKVTLEGKSKSEKVEKVKLIDKFLSEILEFLTTESKYVRESVMSLTGTSISASAYPPLVQYLNSQMKQFFLSMGQVNITPKSTLFVDQSISLVKHILELSQHPDNLSLLIDFEVLIENFVKYVSQLIADETSLRIKKITCLLLQSMMEKRQWISFQNELKFRIRIIGSILEWMSAVTVKTLDFGETGRYPTTIRSSSGQTLVNKSDETKLIVELDIETMKAISCLLRGLPLHGGETDSNAQEQKKVLFLKFFTFFSKLLSRAKEETQKETYKGGSLAEYTIQSLSNLLSANIDSGLQHFVTMGYHEDFPTRTAFLKVLTNILNQGTDFEVGGEVDKFDKLYEIIFDPDLSVILALTDVVQMTEADEVASLLVRIFEVNDKSMHLLQSCLDFEIQRTTDQNTLFRRNSLATKILSAYAKIKGAKYLKELLQPIISYILHNPKTYELEPSQLTPNENLETNIQNVMSLSKQFLDAIIKSLNFCPKEIREICTFLKKIVGKKFPGSENVAIGGFLFLRFFCPAIVSPDGFGIVAESPNKFVRRGLVLATKLLQALANGVPFVQDKKESYMVVVNPFIEQNLSSMKDLLDKFATLSDTQVVSPILAISEEQKEADLNNLHYLLATHLEKIGSKLKGEQQIKRSITYSKLSSALQHMGSAPEPKRKTIRMGPTVMKGGAESTSLYDNFMKSHANINTDSIRDKGFYYRKGTTKDKLPVFYLILRKFTIQGKEKEKEIEINALLYYLLKTTQEYFSKSFIIVVDCTLFSYENIIPLSWCSFFVKHFPSSDCLDKIILINVNSDFKQYSKSISKFLGRAQKKVIFLPFATNIFDYINENEIALPLDTLAVDKDVKASFAPVFKGPKEYTLRVSGQYLQMLILKDNTIFGKNANVIDLYHVSSIVELSLTTEENEIFLKLRSPTSEIVSVRFRSSQSKQIVQALNASRNLNKITKQTNLPRDSKTLSNPSDVPGTLLNMALLNLGSERKSLRLAAYNLLDAICHNFNFSVQLQLLGTEGLYIPKNCFHFVVTESEKLATTQPNLTLEFLLECIRGLKMSKPTPQLKHLVLDYMRPWLPNLSLFYHLTSEEDSAEKVNKTREVIDSLIEFTISENSIVTIILSTIWITIGAVPDIIETVLDCCIQQILKAKTDRSLRLEVIGSIVASIASRNSQITSGKIIARMLQKIGATSTTTIERLEDSQSWPEISIMLQFLFILSFENLICVQQYLPELFHIVLLIFGSGDVESRKLIHGLLINIIHSLYTIKVSEEDKLQNLSFHLQDFNQPKFKLLFGIGGESTAPSVSHQKASSLDKQAQEKVPLSAVDIVANSLYEVLSAVSPGNIPVGTIWHARWLGLTTVVAFTPNSALQPRACVTLGVLCKSSSLVTDELVERVLIEFKEALRESMDSGNDHLAVSLIICLTHMYEFLSPSSFYFKSLFWVTVAIIQISELKLFNAAISFLEVLVRFQEEQEGLGSVEDYYYSARTGAVDQILSKLDRISGLSFKSSFSFGIASNLLKGIKHPRAKENCIRVLSAILGLGTSSGANFNFTSILGYLAALLATEGENVLRTVNLAPPGNNLCSIFFPESVLADPTNIILLVTFMVTLLQISDNTREQIFIYETINEAVHHLPESFLVVEDIAIPLMTELVSKSQSEVLIQILQEILSTVYAYKEANPHSTYTKAYLKEIGYPRLPEAISFDLDPEIQREVTKIVILLVDNLMKEIQEKKGTQLN